MKEREREDGLVIDVDWKFEVIIKSVDGGELLVVLGVAVKSEIRWFLVITRCRIP